MDPINIIIGINVVALFGANISGAKRGVRSSISEVKDKPKTYLQNIPTTIAMLILLATIAAVFQFGTFEYSEEIKNIRLIGLAVYLFFSWFQIWAYRTLGENYSQDIVILKNHQLVQKGAYKYFRHPHYLGQILSDISAAIATLSFVAAPLVLIEISLLVLRAKKEEEILSKYFKAKFDDYKKKTGFFFPFIG